MGKLFSSLLGAPAPAPQPMPVIAPLPPLPPAPPAPKATVDSKAEGKRLEEKTRRRQGRRALIATSNKGFLAPYSGGARDKYLLGE